MKRKEDLSSGRGRTLFSLSAALCLAGAGSGEGTGVETNATAPAGRSPLSAIAGPDRVVILKAKTFLNGCAGYGLPKPQKRGAQSPPESSLAGLKVSWSKASGQAPSPSKTPKPW